MSPQLENGYTRIADEILEKIAKLKLNGTQFRILLIVWRYTYGFSRKETDLSVSFFANALDVSKRQIQRELKSLIEHGILLEVSKPSFNATRVIKFNKNFSHQMTNKTPDDRLDTAPGDGLDTSSGDGLDTQDKHTINNTINSDQKKISYKAVYDHYMTLNLVRHRDYNEEMRDAMKHAEKKLGITVDDMIIMLTRHAEKVRSSKGTEYPTKKRGLAEFFGQKKYQSKMLICSDYLDEHYEQQKPTGHVDPDNEPEWRKVTWVSK